MTVCFELLDRSVLASGKFYASNSICDGEGRILFTYEPGAMETISNFYSKDGGKTFSEIPDMMGIYKFLQLQDGSILGLSRRLQPSDDGSRFRLGLRSASDLAALAAGQYTDSVVSVEIPDLTSGDGDNGKPFTGTLDHGLVQLPGGEILATMYGRFHADRTALTLFPTAAFQYRAWIIRSTDGGQTFHYLSTVADVQTYPVGETAEGYCEPDLCLLPEEKLLCVMRTGGAVGQGPSAYTALRLSVSEDGGRSWSAPRDIYQMGVFPKLFRMKNGALIIAAGRVGQFLLASADNGTTWQEPLVIPTRDARWGYCTTGYTCLWESEPDVLTVVYDDLEPDFPVPQRGTPEHKAYVFGSKHRLLTDRYRVTIRE